MRKPTVRLHVEELEPRTVPSTLHLLPRPVPAPAVVAPVAPLPSIFGKTLQGTYMRTWSTLGHAPRYYLSGASTGAPRDVVLVSGFVSGATSTPDGHAVGLATGQLTLLDGHGSLTLKLLGPPQSPTAGLPASFSFTVQQGTGAYRNLTVHGFLKLSLSPWPNSHSPLLHGWGMSGGRFVLKFQGVTG